MLCLLSKRCLNVLLAAHDQPFVYSIRIWQYTVVYYRVTLEDITQ